MSGESPNDASNRLEASYSLTAGSKFDPSRLAMTSKLIASFLDASNSNQSSCVPMPMPSTEIGPATNCARSRDSLPLTSARFGRSSTISNRNAPIPLGETRRTAPICTGISSGTVTSNAAQLPLAKSSETGTVLDGKLVQRLAALARFLPMKTRRVVCQGCTASGRTVSTLGAWPSASAAWPSTKKGSSLPAAPVEISPVRLIPK